METVNARFTYIALEATQIKSFFKNYFLCKWHLKRKKTKQLFRRWFVLAEEIFEKYVSHLNMRFSGSHPFAEIIPTASLKEWSTAASSTGECYSTSGITQACWEHSYAVKILRTIRLGQTSTCILFSQQWQVLSRNTDKTLLWGLKEVSSTAFPVPW